MAELKREIDQFIDAVADHQLLRLAPLRNQRLQHLDGRVDARLPSRTMDNRPL